MPEAVAALPELVSCRALLGELDLGRRAVLVAVVAHRGASPGRTGWVMGVAHAVHELHYEHLADVVPPGDHTLVVVAAHAPKRDAAAVAALAGTPLAHLGVLGTPAKVAHLPRHAALEVPTGVPIGSHTPDEIAVSVAARLVALRGGSGCE